MRYTFRKSIMTRPTTFELTDHALKVYSEENEREVLYSHIKSVRLHYNPTRVNPNQYECNIGLGNEMLTILNMSFIEFGNFEDQSTSYRSFVEALHQKLMPYTEIRFIGGISRSSYIFYLIMNIAVIWLIVALLFHMGISSELVFVKLLIFGYLLYLRYHYYKKNKPVSYKADEIPENLLPAEKE